MEYQPSGTIRTLSSVLKFLRTLLLIGTVLAATIFVIGIAGYGETSVRGVVERPFTIEFDDGRRMTVGGVSDLSYDGFEFAENDDSQLLTRTPEIRLTAVIQDGDTATRALVLSTIPPPAACGVRDLCHRGHRTVIGMVGSQNDRHRPPLPRRDGRRDVDDAAYRPGSPRASRALR